MEAGHILGQPSTNSIPVTVGWLPSSKGPTGRGLRDQTEADPLAVVGVMRWSPVPRFPAARCLRCQRVEFLYGNPVLIGPGKDEMKA
jgi:hypothetical protein